MSLLMFLLATLFAVGVFVALVRYHTLSTVLELIFHILGGLFEFLAGISG